MKQIIVMIAMVVLGIALAVMIMAFKEPAKTITDHATTSITKTLGNAT